MLLLPLILSMALLVVKIEGATLCPPEADIEPCTCVQNDAPTDISLDCLGSLVRSEVISKLFSSIRSANNITSPSKSSDKVNGTQSNETTETIHDFHIRGTNLTSIDLSPLEGWHFVAVYIYQNPRLTSFFTSSGGGGENLSKKIWAENVEVDTNFLGDAGLTQLLQLLTPDILTKLVVRENKLRAIPELGPFGQLTELDLSYNLIQEIGGGQFKNLTRLERLDLKSNSIHSVGKDAFLFVTSERSHEDDPSEDEDEQVLSIYLDSNKLSDSGFHPHSGLASVGKRAAKLYLRKNNFEYISPANFDPFLKKEGHFNILKLWGNPFVCDEKLKWLRGGGNTTTNEFFYEGRVHSVDCINFVGKTIFTATDMV